MVKTVKSLLEDANAAVPRVTLAEAKRLMAEQGAVIIDVRDAPELEKMGRIPGSHHIPRGMLEFRADPASPYYNPELKPDQPVLLHCASGGRSALAGQRLQEMGYTQVFNIGGFKDWVEAGGEIEEPVDQGM